MSAPPLFVLGVSRSGTTLLRVMLDRNSQLAIPDESYFIRLLANRHGQRPDAEQLVDDLGRIRRLHEWGIRPDRVRQRLRPGMTLSEAIAAVYETHAAAQGKPRWGDKTPMYMQHLGLLERLFPDALFVHLIRDVRDAAAAFVELPEDVPARNWAVPRSGADFACRWRREVRDARALGGRVGPRRYLELFYERLVAQPERELRRICTFADLPYEPGMLEYAGRTDVAEQPHHQHLARPPTPGLRDWRRDLGRKEVARIEAIAGDPLAELGYELLDPRAVTRLGIAARLRMLAYAFRITTWNAAVSTFQRSPLWRLRHPPLV